MFARTHLATHLVIKTEYKIVYYFANSSYIGFIQHEVREHGRIGKSDQEGVGPKGKSQPEGVKTEAATDIAGELRARIASHDLLPGTKLVELELAQEFGTTRPKVREALAALEQRGLVERIPNRGAVVTRISFEQILQIYTAREALEGMSVRLAAEHAPRASGTTSSNCSTHRWSRPWREATLTSSWRATRTSASVSSRTPITR
ncbi:GntR family transcriptional regulator [Cupriavidus sp. D39]|uniref:GntR family transcriptional regulator n=1 Tax=Cupriavidus sp. D39 TaxID=2997877 RepID=UPI00227020D7|nr:GntR family transcriptional regulator [Cupriavidus sp. D39]MCY0852680.1 GntR family transcriptional regulator [Cupriavidus sp. D39]